MSFSDGWKTGRPLLAEACCLLVGDFFLAAFASATDLGRPGSGYSGHAVFAAVAGGLMVYHRSAARRAVCFAALLLALVAMHSEKIDHENFRARVYRTTINLMQKRFEQLAESTAKPSPDQPSPTP